MIRFIQCMMMILNYIEITVSNFSKEGFLLPPIGFQRKFPPVTLEKLPLLPA